MFTPAQLLAMTDNELGTHASGGYGAKLRNEFFASLRAGLEKADAKGQIVERAFGRRERQPESVA